MRCLVAAALLLGCSAPPAEPVAIEPPAFVPLAIEFEPARAGHGVLEVWHESGWSVRVPTRPSGVDLRLPPGPASMRLSVAGKQFQRVVRVSPPAAALRWDFGDN